MKYKSLALAAAALMAGMLSFGGAEAANVMTGSAAPAGIVKFDDSNVQQARHGYKWRRHGNWNRHGHRYRNRYRNNSGIYLGLGFAPFFSPYYNSPYYNSYYDDYDDGYYAPARGSRHVRYCLNRYKTYNVRTNTFRGYDGLRHRCRSPYRY
jgi:hypothetical protein